MRIAIISFSDQGQALAERLAGELGGAVRAGRKPLAAESMRCGQPLSLREWTEREFSAADALVFIGAAGIAVRAIAPYVKKKTLDPAVVVVDEGGHFTISLLSGHIGGANALTERIARLIDAVPVITTATDVRGLFAVDSWAVQNGCIVQNPERIREVSGALLRGEKVQLFSDWPVDGDCPAQVELILTDAVQPVSSDCTENLRKEYGDTKENACIKAERCTEAAYASCPVFLTVKSRAEDDGLVLVPVIAALGIGCRRGTPAETIERAFDRFVNQNGLRPECIRKAASIDLKSDEAGLLEFCRRRGWPVSFYSAEELMRTEGEFTSSEFVLQTTGADNVCERSAVRACGGSLQAGKFACEGVTLALAMKEFQPTFETIQHPV